ncbi:MAG TPA: phage holin family protein [Verrucomicrobiae bacterium]|nr:phage holin family protein [Verrucomicrobiae bacterium]
MNLFGELKEQVKAFIREEVELARKEMTEKISTYARHGAVLAAGGFIAAAGFLAFSVAIGLVIGFAFESLGLNPLLAAFCGLAIMGFLMLSVGGIAVLKGIKAISSLSPAPEKTIDTLKQIKPGAASPSPEPRPAEDPRSSNELHREALGTEQEMAEQKREIAFQLSPQQLKKRTIEHMKTHPLAWAAVASGSLLAGGLVVGRQFLKDHLHLSRPR